MVEAGTGAGAGLLCLASRVAEIAGLGLEIDPEQAGIARRNIAANGSAGLCVQEADVAAWRAEPLFDHAFANPPWHDPAGTPSPQPGRLAAKRAGDRVVGGLGCVAGAGAHGRAARSA